MILVCGATGMLGSRIVTLLRRREHPVRALVRPNTDASALEADGVEIARGDLRDPDSLRAALTGVDTVISTANTIARVMAGERGLTIRDVDDRGHADLIAAAEAAGVQRFIFLSFQDKILDSGTPFARAKLANEERLTRSAMHSVVLKPDMFQEVWLTDLVQFDWKGGKVTIFGKGETPHRYVAVDDVAQAAVRMVETEEPPTVLEFGGPEALTRLQAADAFERAAGRPIKRGHVPRPALRVGSVVLKPFRPVLASIMGQALAADRHPATATDAPLRELGIEPRSASDYIAQAVAESRAEQPPAR